MSGRHGYSIAGGSAADRLYGGAPSLGATARPREWNAARPEPDRFLSVAATTLRIAPFFIRKWEQRYVSRTTIEIDLARLPPGRLRIVAVHDFRSEDRNPDLDECRAAIFLARPLGGAWEAAEDHPVECRSVEVLGHLDPTAQRIAPP